LEVLNRSLQQLVEEHTIGGSSAIRQVMIRGRVQGVGYRAWVEHQAKARQLEGWVRNRRDGDVEALFAGPAAAVADLIVRCRRGPAAALVEAVQDEPAGSDALNLRRAGERFSVLPTI
jgi:acylphosphatase